MINSQSMNHYITETHVPFTTRSESSRLAVVKGTCLRGVTWTWSSSSSSLSGIVVSTEPLVWHKLYILTGESQIYVSKIKL